MKTKTAIKKRGIWLAAVALLLAPSVMFSTPLLDFNIVVPTTGSISYAGGAAPLVGTHIDVDNVVGIGTPLHNLVKVGIIGGFMNFVTGPNTGSNSTQWFFGGGATSTMTLVAKCLDIDHDGGSCDSGDIWGGGNSTITVWTGHWEAATVTDLGPIDKRKPMKDRFKIDSGLFDDIKNPQLLKYYGLGSEIGRELEGSINLSFDAAHTPPNAFRSSKVLSGDVQNLTPVVPEPASLALLGTGLIGIAGIARRRLLAARTK